MLHFGCILLRYHMSQKGSCIASSTSLSLPLSPPFPITPACAFDMSDLNYAIWNLDETTTFLMCALGTYFSIIVGSISDASLATMVWFSFFSGNIWELYSLSLLTIPFFLGISFVEKLYKIVFLFYPKVNKLTTNEFLKCWGYSQIAIMCRIPESF